MTTLYLSLLLGSLLVPLLFTVFRVDFIKHWKSFLLSTSLIAAIFLVWDALFTHLGIWKFNADYYLNFTILRMPIEEWLFFFIIPFCSLFIHFALISSYPKLSLSKKATRLIAIVLIAMTCIVLATNLSKAYTAVNSISLLLVLTLGVLFHLNLLQRFFLSFLIILIPFFIVNGILTGSGLEAPVVLYNDAENMGIRLLTIPVEDLGYAFTMLFGNLMIFESLTRRTKGQ
jgi:lycopene cyclase domain-containing protein